MNTRRREVISQYENELTELTRLKQELSELKDNYNQQQLRSKGVFYGQLGWDVAFSSSNIFLQLFEFDFVLIFFITRFYKFGIYYVIFHFIGLFLFYI
jgi:hypothetical protein